MEAGELHIDVVPPTPPRKGSAVSTFQVCLHACCAPTFILGVFAHTEIIARTDAHNAYMVATRVVGVRWFEHTHD